jgi:hypothetical protein
MNQKIKNQKNRIRLLIDEINEIWNDGKSFDENGFYINPDSDDSSIQSSIDEFIDEIHRSIRSIKLDFNPLMDKSELMEMIKSGNYLDHPEIIKIFDDLINNYPEYSNDSYSDLWNQFGFDEILKMINDNRMD